MMKEKRFSTIFIAQGAIIAALYVALTVIFAPISYGLIQVRISEMLTILPMFTPAAISGLFLGCLIANLIGGAIIWDIVFGSIATLIGAFFSYLLRKKRWLVPLPAIAANALIIPFILKYGYGVDAPLLLIILYLLIGEAISCYVLGELLGGVLLRYGKRLFSGRE